MLTIGRLAGAAGLSRDTIRFYERAGLLQPASRTDNGYRLYTDDDVRRLAFIKHAQLCGCSLDTIRALLQSDGETHARGSTAYRTAAGERELITRKISALCAMRDALASFITHCDGDSRSAAVTPGKALADALFEVTDGSSAVAREPAAPAHSLKGADLERHTF